MIPSVSPMGAAIQSVVCCGIIALTIVGACLEFWRGARSDKKRKAEKKARESIWWENPRDCPAGQTARYTQDEYDQWVSELPRRKI